MMLIGTLSLTGFPFTAGYYLQGRDHRGRLRVACRYGPFAFVLLVIAAFCTSFYSWRLMFMTFHGKPRAAAETSWSMCMRAPQVMLVPLYVLAAGALARGLHLRRTYFIGHDEAAVLGAVIASAETRDHRGDAPCAALGRLVALRRHGAGLRACLSLLHPPPRSPGAARRAARAALPVPAQQVVLRRALRLHLRPSRQVARPLPVEEGRRLAHRRLRPGRRLGPRDRRHQPASSGCRPAISFTMPSPC